jgi:hypothetical protein
VLSEVITKMRSRVTPLSTTGVRPYSEPSVSVQRPISPFRIETVAGTPGAATTLSLTTSGEAVVLVKACWANEAL